MPPHDDDEAPHPGKIIGGVYRVVRRLGMGGTATVWEVERTDDGERLALKLLHRANEAHDVVVSRFHREARAAAAIDHPNVVRLVDHAVDAALGPYIVMELLSGEPLSNRMDPGLSFTLRQTVEWLRPVASALDALHTRGLVHRDVKPENIVSVEDGATVKLVDLGLAVHADGSDRLTRRGTLLGTPHYMAPEVGEGSEATSASDVYALAVVAYELLTGSTPHDGDSPMDVLTAKLVEEAPSLGERTGRMFAVPIEMAFAEALDRDPAARPATATAFVERLARALR